MFNESRWDLGVCGDGELEEEHSTRRSRSALKAAPREAGAVQLGGAAWSGGAWSCFIWQQVPREASTEPVDWLGGWAGGFSQLLLR